MSAIKPSLRTPFITSLQAGDLFILERNSGIFTTAFSTISGQGGGGGGTTNITNGVTGISITGSSSITGLVNITGAGTVTTQQKGNTLLISGTHIDSSQFLTGSGTFFQDTSVSYWKLDEANGIRFDSIGNSHLIPSGVGTGIGKFGNCIYIPNTTSASGAPCLYIPDNSHLRSDRKDFTISLWYNHQPKITGDLVGEGNVLVYKGIASNWSEPELGYEWYISIRKDAHPSFYSFEGDGVSSQQGFSTGQWHHLCAWYEAVSGSQNIQIDGGQVFSTPHQPIDPVTGSYFLIGGWTFSGKNPSDPAMSGQYFRGYIDEVYFTKRILSPTERAYLYNNGAGQTYRTFGNEFELPSSGLIPNNVVTGSGTAGTIAKFSTTNSGVINSSLSETSTLLSTPLKFQPISTLRGLGNTFINSGATTIISSIGSDLLRIFASGNLPYANKFRINLSSPLISEQFLLYSASGTVTMLNSGNNSLNGDWIGDSGNSIKIFYDGTNYREEYRSINNVLDGAAIVTGKNEKINFIGNNISGTDPSSSTLAIPISTTVFGSSTGLLGVPAGWLNISISGNNYKLPYFN